MVAERFRKDGYDCEVAMIAHGGWSLSQLMEEPEVQFNIRYGHYDYVMLQDMSNPFESERRFMRSIAILAQDQSCICRGPDVTEKTDRLQ